MSARNAVYGELMWPEWNSTSESHGTSDAVANELLDAYRAEVLREAAEKILDDSWSRRNWWGEYENEDREAGMRDAADLIDPDRP